MNRNREPWNRGRGGDVKTTRREGKGCSCKRHVTPNLVYPGIGVESRQRAWYHWPGGETVASEHAEIVSGDKVIPSRGIKQGYVRFQRHLAVWRGSGISRTGG